MHNEVRDKKKTKVWKNNTLVYNIKVFGENVSHINKEWILYE